MAVTSSAAASESSNTASVSSRESRSSGLTKTAAGIPLRVTTPRSWCFCTRLMNSENRSRTLDPDHDCPITWKTRGLQKRRPYAASSRGSRKPSSTRRFTAFLAA